MEKWSFNGIDLCNNKAWGVEQVLDGSGPPGFRGSDILLPFNNGNTHVKKCYNSKKIILGMWVAGFDKVTGKAQTGKDIYDTLEENIEYLSTIFGRPGQHTLKRTMRDGSYREAQAEIISSVPFVVQNGGYCKFSLELELADPFFYGTTKETESKTISAAEVYWNLTVDCPAPVSAMVITFTGPLTNPGIKNVDRDIWVQYQDSLAEGEEVVLNTKDFTCVKGSENVLSAIRHGGDPHWLLLENGVNAMKASSQDVTGGKVEIEYYPVYF